MLLPTPFDSEELTVSSLDCQSRRRSSSLRRVVILIWLNWKECDTTNVEVVGSSPTMSIV